VKTIQQSSYHDSNGDGVIGGEGMEPIYATVRKRSSPPRQQNMISPQLPVNIQPQHQPEYFRSDMDQFAYQQNHFREKVGFQPVHGYEGFRPMQARNFRQNTWGSGYQVIIVYSSV